MLSSALTHTLISNSTPVRALIRSLECRWRCTGCATFSSYSGNRGDKHSPIRHNVPDKHSYPPFISLPCSSDVRKLLDELSGSSDPGETKYWLAQFQKTAEISRDPFAVLQVSTDVFDSPDELKSLASCVSLLQKMNLRCVLVHGLTKTELQDLDFKCSLQSAFHWTVQMERSLDFLESARQQLTTNTMELVDLFESLGSPARPLFPGAGVIEASLLPMFCSTSRAVGTHAKLIRWSLRSGHIPIIPCVGETEEGQLIVLDRNDVLAVLLPQVTPRKVLLVSFNGGLLDDSGEVISTINVPKDLEWAYMMPWCSDDVKKRITYISELLHKLSPQTSIVLTTPASLLTELFTHHGSGTLFKNTEAIRTYTSLEDIDSARLLEVINSDFGRELGEPYLEKLATKLNTLYLSEDYNAVAIVTDEPGMAVPYLDKFSVTDAGKTDGLCQLQWDMIRRDFPKLFWRSRHANKVSSWYFKKCEGSWTNGEWIVFWYGIHSHKESSILTDYALTLEDSFATTVKDFRPVL